MGLFFLLIKPSIYKAPDNQVAEPQIELYLHQKNKTITLSLEEYIIGTVAAEMPASFAMEALQAQAVCARTYALKKLIEKHPYPLGADLSDDINSCQAFREVFSYPNRMNEQNLERVERAVNSTRGEVLLYKDQPIDALYHSTCGGKTETAESVPYLRSVKCTYCRSSPHYYEESKFNNETINHIVGDRGHQLNIQIMSKTSSGRINEITINGKKIYAAKLRRELDLPSQWLTFRNFDNQTQINSRGYGHGLGLCQYGANGMANKGKNYKQILQHYYHDVDLYKIPY